MEQVRGSVGRAGESQLIDTFGGTDITQLTPPSPDTPESWGSASRGYAEKVAPFLMRTFADALVERLDVDSNTEALEVGAGSGALTRLGRSY